MSKRRRGLRRGVRRAVLLACGAGCVVASARVFKTVDRALDEAYPGTRVERRAVYFTDGQRRAISRDCGERYHAEFTAVYEVHAPTGLVGRAYFEAERVRSHAQTAMVVVDREGRIDRFEIIAYHEPIEYLPPQAWYDRLRGRTINDRLRLGRDVDGVTGATLSVRAAVRTARRVLAIHRTIVDAGPEGGK